MMIFILALWIATILLASYAVWVLVFIINADFTTPNIEERENYPFKDLRMRLSIYLKEQDESNSRLKQRRSNYSDQQRV
jgi:hypothetical protein